MHRTITKDRPTVDLSPILRSLLERPLDSEIIPVRDRSFVRQQHEILERRGTALVAETRTRTGVEIEYLGNHPLFNRPRLYTGEPNDWVLGPANRSDDLVVPKAEQAVLRRLEAEDIYFPLLYVAHEVPKDKTQEIIKPAGATHAELEPAKASELIGPVPDPHSTAALGDRLNQRAGQVFRGIRRTAVAGGVLAAGVVAAPVVLTGAAFVALAQVDPIILGAIPAGESREGQLAGFFVLARWDW